MSSPSADSPDEASKSQITTPPMYLAGNVNSLAYFRGRIIPLSEATVSIAAHALNYGTGCFEGVRAYWNADHEELYIVRMRDHFERFARSRRVLKIQVPESIDDLCAITIDLLRRLRFRENAYIRPLAFKSEPTISLGLSNLENTLAILAIPMGDYLDIARGLNVCVSGWRRIASTAMPLRAKPTGAYLNTALAAEEAHASGFDDAIFLTESGMVSEASSSNLFMFRHGELITPRLADDIVEGITRACVFDLSEKYLGKKVIERAVNRAELFDADELFLTGTGMQVAPVTRLDGRQVGLGQPGPITLELQRRYFNAVMGNDDEFNHWCTAVYT